MARARAWPWPESIIDLTTYRYTGMDVTNVQIIGQGASGDKLLVTIGDASPVAMSEHEFCSRLGYCSMALNLFRVETENGTWAEVANQFGQLGRAFPNTR